MDNDSAVAYLSSLLNRVLRIHIHDTRLFVGTFRCTDGEMNVILSNAYEYRQPTAAAQRAAVAKAAAAAEAGGGPSSGTVKADMKSRFVGLIVVPGKEIAQIELEDLKPWERTSPGETLPIRSKD